jgi:hypothetical protein
VILLISIAAVLVALSSIEIAMVFCETPAAFRWGWKAADRVLAVPFPPSCQPGIRGCTHRTVYRVLESSHVIFVSQDVILYRNPAGPLRGSITASGGRVRIVGRTPFAFYMQHGFFAMGLSWWEWNLLRSPATIFFALFTAGTAIAFIAWAAHHQLEHARREFAVDVAEVTAALVCGA